MRNRFMPVMLSLLVGAGGGAVGATAVLLAKPTVEAKPAYAAPAVESQPGPGQGEAIADLVDKVGPAVVNIDTVSKKSVNTMTMDPYWNPFMGSGSPFQQKRQTIQQKGVGSGFIIRENGLIVTNNHVIAGATELSVTLPDGRKLKGKVIGTDPGSDLALVKVEASKLPFLTLADPKSLRVGQWTVAIGSPLGLQHTVTAGILSAIDREISLNDRVGFLQTSAPINPGNSGGPLLNMRGEVIGVNTAVASHAQGIGFAVPASTLSRVLPQLETKGKVERAWLGVGLRDLRENRQEMFFPADSGAVIVQVDPEGPAAKAGLLSGDIISELNGKSVKTAHDLIRSINGMKSGDKIALLVNREGQRKTLNVTLGQMPQRVVDAQNAPQQPQGPQGMEDGE